MLNEVRFGHVNHASAPLKANNGHANAFLAPYFGGAVASQAKTEDRKSSRASLILNENLGKKFSYEA